MDAPPFLARVPPLLRTEWIALRASARVEKARGHLILRTPSNPDYHCGNSLWMPRAPRPGDELRWPALFARAFRGAVRHMTFFWDGEPPRASVLARFRARGFHHEVSDGLVAERRRPAPRVNAALECSVVRGARAWSELRAFHESLRPVSTRGRRFLRRLYADYRRLAERGGGDWYVARLRGRVVGKLGLYHHRGTGRFQSIETARRFQRRGVCTTLMDYALRRAFGELRLRRVFIAADPKGEAIRVYRRLGFRRFGRADDLVFSPDGYAG